MYAIKGGRLAVKIKRLAETKLGSRTFEKPTHSSQAIAPSNSPPGQSLEMLRPPESAT